MKRPWYVRQKPAVALVAGLGGLFALVNPICAQPWATTDAPAVFGWEALAASADGTRLIAVPARYASDSPAPIHISTNSGANWAQTSAPTNNWKSVASSAGGARLVAVASAASGWVRSDALIYTSPDGGANWSPANAPSNTWSGVASSADGVRLVAVAEFKKSVWNGTNLDYLDYVGDGMVYASSDAGATWTRTTAPTNNWTSVASSADGTKLVAGASWTDGDGLIYTSPDGGASWSPTRAPSSQWKSVASSANGAKLVATDGYRIHLSTNSGATWTATSAPEQAWSGVATSADGTRLVAVAEYEASGAEGLIYTSSDSGATWTPTGAPAAHWRCVACSADGYRAVAGGIFSLVSLPYSGPWRLADAPRIVWGSVASSADGRKLVAAALPNWRVGWQDPLYTSSDSGATWTPANVPTNWWSFVASSADGTKLVAASLGDAAGNPGRIYTSSDSGATWLQTTAPSNEWRCVASSADGVRLVAAAARAFVGGGIGYAGEDAIYRSTDSGSTWGRTSAPSNQWTALASSVDGMKLVASSAPEDHWDGTNYSYIGEGAIYVSLDAGATWMRTSCPSNHWASVASSADGTKLVAAANSFPTAGPLFGAGPLYVSTNSGVTWTPTSAPSNGWFSVASSSDGVNLVATANGQVHTSADSGATWRLANTPAVNGLWRAAASSADGSSIVALGDGAISFLHSPPPAPPVPPSPRLLVERTGANIGVSWLMPSTRFVLQQSAELPSANWADVPTSPTLDFTNLHYRVTLTPSLSKSFYRLKQQ